MLWIAWAAAIAAARKRIEDNRPLAVRVPNRGTGAAAGARSSLRADAAQTPFTLKRPFRTESSPTAF